MSRLLAIVLLVPLVLIVALQAQRSVATFQGHAGLRGHSQFVGSRSFSNGVSPQRGLQNWFFPNHFHRHHDRHNGVLFPYFFPEYDPFWYEESDTEEATIERAPPVVIEQRDEGQVRMPENPAPKSQIIDIPGAPNSKVAKMLPPTIFILMNGERLESRRFLLTASDFSLNINRCYRTFPRHMLNLDATIAANRERGIHLRVPSDRNEISLSF